MNKSSVKVIELFAYAVILIVVILWAASRGGFYKPYNGAKSPFPTTTSTSTTSNIPTAPPTKTPNIEKPVYKLPPKGEF